MPAECRSITRLQQCFLLVLPGRIEEKLAPPFRSKKIWEPSDRAWTTMAHSLSAMWLDSCIVPAPGFNTLPKKGNIIGSSAAPLGRGVNSGAEVCTQLSDSAPEIENPLAGGSSRMVPFSAISAAKKRVIPQIPMEQRGFKDPLTPG
jgi:hypothetical protein